MFLPQAAYRVDQLIVGRRGTGRWKRLFPLDCIALPLRTFEISCIHIIRCNTKLLHCIWKPGCIVYKHLLSHKNELEQCCPNPGNLFALVGMLHQLYLFPIDDSVVI
jgi:hypothetical protein